MIFRKIRKEIIILLSLASIAALIRLYINFYTQFIPGAVGAYYILQVRSLLQSGHLYMRETPLIFYLETAIAKIVLLLFPDNLIKVVDYTVRIFDSVIPVLSVFPAYFLAKEILGDKSSKVALIIISSISIFYVSFFILVSEFQKNSLGIVWLFCFLLFVYKLLMHRGIKNFLFAVLFLFLTGLTHFGCFAVAVFLTVIIVFVNYLNNLNPQKAAKLFILIFLIGIGGIFLVSITARYKLRYITQLIFESFHDPLIISLIRGKPVISPVDIASVLFMNLTAITALYFYLFKNKRQNNKEEIFFLSIIISSLILSSPFLGTIWAVRLYYISYIFLIPLIIYIYKSLPEISQKKIILRIGIVVMFMSLLITISTTPVSNMDSKCYSELVSIKSVIPEDGRSIIVAREGLHYWVGLIFNIHAAEPVDVHSGWWHRADHVYFLVQVNDKKPFGLAGLYGEPFSEPLIPDSAVLVFSGHYYKLYLIPYPSPGM